MPVPPGSFVGPYEIQGTLGAGGMGEVYKAWDAKLQRHVAIKVLLDEHARDPDLPGRLEREALILASLNHPGIATVFGIESWQGSPAVVMELVDGESLADRCRRGPLPIADALRIARSLAAALSFAHDHGVVHRDLKPANIRLRHDGSVKVLDFGLARSSGTALGSGGMEGHTRTGALLGTVQYMAPEQLRGHAFDRRVDIWAFGCTVFEMLTGRSPFARSNEADTITAILQEEPDWVLLPGTAAPAVRSGLERCLQKDARQRLRDIADARFDDASTSSVSGTTMGRPGPRVDRLALWGGVALAAVTAAVVLLPGWWGRGAASDGALRKFEVMVDGLGQMPGTYVGESGPGAGVSISPDGRRIVYPRDGRLWVRELSQLESRPLDGTAGAVAPTWSPDGESLAYAVGNQIKRLPNATSTTSTPVTVATTTGAFVEAGALAWATDGSISFTTGNGPIFRVSAQGGDATLVLAQESGERDFHDLVPLPGSRGTLVVAHLTSGQYAVDLLEPGGRRRLFGPLPQVIRHVTYSATGHLLYQRVDRNPGVWAVPVDPATLTAIGDPFLVAAAGLKPSLAADGTLVFVTDEQWGLQRLSVVDRSGVVVRDIGEPVRGLRSPALSRDDRRIAVMQQGSQHDDVWLYDVATGQPTQFTTDGSRGDPAWDPSGQLVGYSCGATSAEGGTCVREASGTGEARLIAPRASMASFAPDGSLVHVLLEPVSRTDVWLTRPGLAAPSLLVRTPAFEYHPRVSPDGHYLAYATSVTGRPDVFVTTFPAAKERWQVSPESGAEPRWKPEGGELYYVDNAGRLQAVAIDTGGRTPPAAPRPLFTETASSLRLTDGYAPSSTGEWFVVIRDADRARARPRITVVQNWFAEFRP